MVEETSPELSLGDEASSSRRKRQRLPSPVEEAASGDRNRDGDECDNGHIACSSCCTKLMNKCPTCKVPTGKIRCRFAESIVEASIVPCPNAKHGCTQKFSYGKELAHEEECAFALCYCPARNCNYTGKYKDLYSHFYANHNDYDYFVCGTSHSTFLYNGMENKVFQERRDGPLVVVQSFRVQQGMHVTVNCIAPCAPGVGKFSYNLSYSRGHHSNAFGPVEVNRIQKVSLQTPEKGSCMFVPDYFLSEEYYVSEMNICIGRLVDEEGVEQGGEEAEEGVEEEESESESEHDDYYSRSD